MGATGHQSIGKKSVSKVSDLPPMHPGGMRINSEEESAVIDVLRRKRLFRFSGAEFGPSPVGEFEAAFSEKLGVSHSIAVTSGTAALITSLVALGIGPGDEVIVPGYTWIATPLAAVAVGAIPIIAEIDNSLTLDPADVEKKITSRTKAIIPVHMRGSPCDMTKLNEVARRHNLFVVEDVAQAAGGTFKGASLGSLGDLGAFSFQFYKILTCGEGGMVTTNNNKLYQRAFMYHDIDDSTIGNIGIEHILPGVNYRMSEIHGAIAKIQLGKLDDILATMRRLKSSLKARLKESIEQAGGHFRVLNDDTGDTGISLILMLPSVELARTFSENLSQRNVPNYLLYSESQRDMHVYPFWKSIIEKRTISTGFNPWSWGEHTGDYSADMCQRSLDTLARSVNLDVSPDLSEQHVHELVTAVSESLVA